MAQKTYNSVVYWRKSGIGVIPGIVIKTRLEQQLDGTLAEVLTLLYAHPDDEGAAHHQANDVGDVAFSVYPLRDKTDTLPAVSFGWADTLEAFDATPLPSSNPPQQFVPLGLSDGHGGWTREGSDTPLTAASVVTHSPVVVDTNPAGAVVAAPVVIDPIAEPASVETVVEGKFGPLDTDGRPYPGEPRPDGEVYPSGVGSTPESRAEYEVFADPEGKTIGIPDGAGGYEHIRDNPFPPESGENWEGKPIK